VLVCSAAGVFTFSRKNKKIFFFVAKKENLEEVRDEKKEKRKLQTLRKEEKNPVHRKIPL